MHTRLIPFVRAAATVAVVAGTMFASAASAQVCPYNSTQGTCACPTSGAGTTCFGGQLFRSSDNSCQNDARPCAANQNWNCSTTSCVCNTASYPCGGCTAASSTIGAACSAPTGGTYTNVCGACSCPAGTTICSSSNTCVANRICPQGTTWDPCTDTCGTPNVLLSPGWIQSGFIQVNGDVKSTAGNIRLDSATAAGQGDIYVANGKAIRVDGTGVTNINIGNWGVGGTGVDVNFPATSRLCFGATCRNSWPSTTDFNPTYINANGDTMTGDLNLTGATTDLFVAGNLGIGTTTPVDGRLEIVRPSTSYRGNIVFGTGANNDWEIGQTYADNRFAFKAVTSQPIVGPMIMLLDPSGRVGINTETPAEALDVAGKVKSTGFQLTTGAANGLVLVSDASGNGTWQTTPGIGGSGTTNYVPKFTAASTVGNSQIFDNGTGVGVGTASPDGTHKLTVDSSGVSTLINRTVGVNNATQWVGTVRLTSTGTIANEFGPTLTFSVAGSGIGPNNIATITATRQGSDSLGDLRFATGATLSPQMTISSTGNVGLGTTAPAAKLQVNDGSVLFTGTTGAIPATGAGTRMMWYPGKSAFRAGLASGPNWDDAYIGTSSAAVGADTQAGNYSFAAGNYSYATGTGSAAFGQSSGASGNYSLASGYATTAAGAYAAAFGYASSAGGTMSFATAQGNASGAGSVAMGQYTNASASYSQAYGSFTEANGYKSVVIGNGFDGTAGGKLINNTGYSIMFGTHSSVPTMTIYNQSPGIGTIGKVGIGTTSPDSKLHVMNGSAGTVTAHSNAAITAEGSTHTYLNILAPDANETGILFGKPSNNISGGIVYNNSAEIDGFQFRTAGNSTKMTLSSAGNLGIGTGTLDPAAPLSVGGNGVNVYATDAWIENNMHVQGNETVGSGRGRLRVGTAWNIPGIYAEANSVGETSDLVLGASSDLVQINAGTFGRPYNAAWLALWGSRIGDAGGGTLSIRSGGGVVAFDGSDYVGVGTTAPQAALHVASGDTGYTTANYRRSIQVGPESYGSGVITWPWDGSGRWGIFGNGGDLRISRTYWNGSYNEETPTYHVFLTSAGDMGVGTNISGVTAKLDVNGDTRVRGNIWSDGNWWDGGSGWIYCGGGGDCACPNGMWVGRVWNSGQYIACYGL